MNNYDVDNWIFGVLVSLRDFAQKFERETIADRLDETILAVANEGYPTDAQGVRNSSPMIDNTSKATALRRRH